MDSNPSDIPRIPPQHQQSRTVDSLGSYEYRCESVDPSLQLEWDTYSAIGVACEVMLTGLFPGAPPSPNEATFKELRLRLEEALSMRPEVAQYVLMANICNDVLAEYYDSNPPTEHQPARWFIPLGWPILNSRLVQWQPDVIVVIRSSWEEHVRSQLDKAPIAQRMQSKEWKKLFPEYQVVEPRIMNLLINPSSLQADDLDAQLLRASAIHPPWECIVAIVEFGDFKAPHPMTSTSTSVSSNTTHISQSERRKGSNSNESTSGGTPVKLYRTPRPPSINERQTTPPASKSASSSQSNSTKMSSLTLPASRKTLSPEAQLLSYFCEVMSANRYRDWTLGVIINGMDFSLVTFDREGAIKSDPTSFRTADGLDTFARWVLAVGSGTLAEPGFSNIFGQTAGQIGGVNLSVPDYAKRASEASIQLNFGKQHYQQYGAFGRGTTLYCVDITMGNTKIVGVCKISWPAATRDSEYDLLQQAREVDPIHLPEVICAWNVEGSVLPSRKLRLLCPQAAVKYEPRVLRILAFPFYGPIDELEGEEFFAAFWDIMICNVKLYEANSVHHRDSSVNNTMYRREEDGGVVGILSDFGLAMSMTKNTKPSSVHCGGTAPFMALDLLALKTCEQDLEHDFESAL